MHNTMPSSPGAPACVMRLEQMDESTGVAPTLAFASSNGREVDGHFGSAPRFYLYAIKAERFQLLGIVDCETGEGHDSNRLGARIAALSGCRVVLCNEIGQGALRQLRDVGIEALRVPEGAGVMALLKSWQAGELGMGPRASAEPAGRFDQYLEEGWQDES